MSTSSRRLAAFFGVMALAAMLSLGAFALLNWTADPVWIWGTQSRLNRISKPFDIRMQRINLLLQRPGAYQTLIVGSSRVANIRFTDEARAFDFSVHTMLPQECADIVSTSIEANGHGFTRVYIGLDFETTNGHYRSGLHESFASMLRTARAPWYRLETTVSASTLTDSVDTIVSSLRGDVSGCMVGPNASPCYDPQRRFFMRPLTAKAWETQSAGELKRYAKAASTYWFNPAFGAAIRGCRYSAGAHVFAFLTPEHARLFELQTHIVDPRHYRRFVREAVDVFGRVLAFDPRASFWSRSDTFFDLHHPQPVTAALLSTCIESAGFRCDPRLGAVVLDRSSQESFLQAVDHPSRDDTPPAAMSPAGLTYR